MAQIAGLSDLRGAGSPGDIGTFQVPCSVLVFQFTFSGVTNYVAIRAGISGWVPVGSNANLRTVIASAQTYLAGLGGGSIFLNLIGTHVFAPTLVVTVIGISFFGLGKSTVLQVNGAAPAKIFQVDADDVTFQNLAFDGNKAAYVSPSEIDGINVINDSARTLITGCYFYNFHNNNDHPIEVENGSAATDVVVANCHFNNTDSYSVAFASAGGHCIVYGCVVVASWGIEAGSTGSYNIVANNVIRDGVGPPIQLNFAYNIAIGNTITNCAHLRISANNCSVIGNVLMPSPNLGIEVFGVDDALIVDNSIFGVTYGIRVDANSDRTAVLSNRINCTRGVRIDDATATNTIIMLNNFNGCTAPVVFEAGNPTVIVPTLILPFVQGTTFLSADGAAWGWEIDAAAEYAIALGHLPSAVQQVLYVKIMAVALVLEADAMRLEINGYGGASNEAFNQNTIAEANKPSATTNFAANDYVYWWLTPTAYGVSISNLLGGDSFMVKVLHEAAGGGDCATDAVFLCAVIEYV